MCGICAKATVYATHMSCHCAPQPANAAYLPGLRGCVVMIMTLPPSCLVLFTPKEKRFICPWDGSTFERNSQYMRSPAPRNRTVSRVAGRRCRDCQHQAAGAGAGTFVIPRWTWPRSIHANMDWAPGIGTARDMAAAPARAELAAAVALPVAARAAAVTLATSYGDCGGHIAAADRQVTCDQRPMMHGS